MLVEVVQGSRGSYSGCTDCRNIKPAQAGGSPHIMVAPPLHEYLVLLSRSVLLAGRSYCCGEDN